MNQPISPVLDLDLLDLDSYFDRIGYAGDRSPTLTTLQAIHAHHAQSIAFENLTPLLKQPVRLDLSALQQKLIHQKRGGYCFEQNLLLRAVLLQLGFQVTNLAARVLWNQPKGTITPRSHMLLRVEIDQTTYLADVGFGGTTLTAPLLLIPDLQQSTPHEPFRLIASDGTYIMQALLRQEWVSLYQFDLQVQQLPDYEVSNWYVSTHPNSLFTQSLLAARPDTGCRHALRNNQFVTHFVGGGTKRTTLDSVPALRTVLEDQFQLQLPEGDTLDLVLQRLVES
jgi:N-hydroxyarylamine O-acetyltransferase